MIKPLIDTFCRLPYQLDYAQTHFNSGHYQHLNQLSALQLNDLVFVLRYLLSVGLKSENSFNRYRNEIEKLVLWLWFHKDKTLTHIDEAVLKEYLQFLQAPPSSWQSAKRATRFKEVNNLRVYNQLWRPLIGHTQNYESRASLYTVLNHFCSQLVEHNLIVLNPIKKLRKCDAILNQNTKPKQKRTSHTLSFISQLFKESSNNIHRTRDLLLYYFVKNKHIPLTALSAQDGEFEPLLAHLDISNDLFYYYQNGELTQLNLCHVGASIAHKYIQLRGVTVDENAPLFHKQRGHGAFEVRQLRRMISAIDNEINSHA